MGPRLGQPLADVALPASGRSWPISFGIGDHVETGGKKSLSVISSMSAIGRSTVSGRPSAWMCACMVSLLHIGLSTAKTHLASLMAKLGARNRVEIAMWAYETRRIIPGT